MFQTCAINVKWLRQTDNYACHHSFTVQYITKLCSKPLCNNSDMIKDKLITIYARFILYDHDVRNSQYDMILMPETDVIWS